MLNIDSIFPVGEFSLRYPYYSLEFYQKYWKPIVESIGHFYNIDFDTLLVTNKSELPDVPKKAESIILSGWNVGGRKNNSILLAFTEDMWMFNNSSDLVKSAVTSIYNEQDYLDAVVKCIDPQLKSIFNRTGAVIQVIPQTDYIEIDVDFGRGIGVIRLTEKQTEIIPLDFESNTVIKKDNTRTAASEKSLEDILENSIEKWNKIDKYKKYKTKDYENFIKEPTSPTIPQTPETMAERAKTKYIREKERLRKERSKRERPKEQARIEKERLEKERLEKERKERELKEEKELAEIREIIAKKNI